MSDTQLHSLIPSEDFKALLSLDDRDDAMSRYCLLTATYTIEQYCRRRLLRKRLHERLEQNGDLLFLLREYPVREILSLYVHFHFDEPDFVEPDLYEVIPDCAEMEDVPHLIRLSPALRRLQGVSFFRAVYSAGYDRGSVPADLASACMELAMWNFNRYKGRRIGLTGNVRGNGKDGEHFENSMPENVRKLIEPYKRVLI
jgi:hypothetical protein